MPRTLCMGMDGQVRLVIRLGMAREELGHGQGKQ